MKKSDKKIENAIVKALNNVCETLTVESDGFCWLTHFVDYSNFPQSLKLVCVYETNQSLEAARNNAIVHSVLELTESRLKHEGVFIQASDKAIFFDTVENGADVERVGWCRKYS